MTCAMREVYLVHYLQQSCGWVKIAEYALAPEDVARVQVEIQARHPEDVLRFEVRNPRNIKADDYADVVTGKNQRALTKLIAGLRKSQ